MAKLFDNLTSVEPAHLASRTRMIGFLGSWTFARMRRDATTLQLAVPTLRPCGTARPFPVDLASDAA